MKNRVFAITSLVLVLGYGFLFLRHYPVIDPSRSRFSIACNNNATDAGSIGGFGEIPGSAVKVVAKTGINPRNRAYEVSDLTWDVVSKVVCNDPTQVSGQDSMAKAASLYQTVANNQDNPQVTIAHNAAPNYSVEMTTPVYNPSWTLYVMKIMGLVALLGLAYLFTR